MADILQVYVSPFDLPRVARTLCRRGTGPATRWSVSVHGDIRMELSPARLVPYNRLYRGS